MQKKFGHNEELARGGPFPSGQLTLEQQAKKSAKDTWHDVKDSFTLAHQMCEDGLQGLQDHFGSGNQVKNDPASDLSLEQQIKKTASDTLHDIKDTFNQGLTLLTTGKDPEAATSWTKTEDIPKELNAHLA